MVFLALGATSLLCVLPPLVLALVFVELLAAKLDGTGTRRAVESITSGLGWRAVQEPMICHGEWREDFVEDCHTLGMAMAAGLDGGIF